MALTIVNISTKDLQQPHVGIGHLDISMGIATFVDSGFPNRAMSNKALTIRIVGLNDCQYFLRIFNGRTCRVGKPSYFYSKCKFRVGFQRFRHMISTKYNNSIRVPISANSGWHLKIAIAVSTCWK